MSHSADVNLLLYASDEASPRHTAAREFLEGCAANPKLFCLGWPTVMSDLRIASDPSIFAASLSLAEALANVEALLALPQVRVLSEADGVLEIYREITRDIPKRGNLVPDAHLAALLRQHGVRVLYTSDLDFRKFSFLDVRNPFR